ncbi:hypothetical protein CSQ85_08905 [Bifidobacterium rousetti]|uniref:hypothetical protein n=1 Tax=Bifidobacterium rousetti TaxID=2045439 RepID=UPI00123A8066|nr:hypothetical protein [Bifidobacterium rousetti]KAA8818269.1 hypothetical protein CSQ85_08905 [Bifidobacterium rousetti]
MVDHGILPAEHINVLAWAIRKNDRHHTDLADEQLQQETEQYANLLARLNTQDHGGDPSAYQWAEPRHTDWDDYDIFRAFSAYIHSTPSYHVYANEPDAETYNMHVDLVEAVADTMSMALLRTEAANEYGPMDVLGDMVINADSTPDQIHRDWYLNKVSHNMVFGISPILGRDETRKIRTDERFANAPTAVDRLRFAAERFEETINRTAHDYSGTWADEKNLTLERFAPLTLEAYGVGPMVEDATDTDRKRAASILGDEILNAVEVWDEDVPTEETRNQWVDQVGIDEHWHRYLTDELLTEWPDEQFYERLDQSIRGFLIDDGHEDMLWSRMRHYSPVEEEGADVLTEHEMFEEYYVGLVGKALHADDPSLDREAVVELLQDAYPDDYRRAYKHTDVTPASNPKEAEAVRNLVRDRLDIMIDIDNAPQSGDLYYNHNMWMYDVNDMLDNMNTVASDLTALVETWVSGSAEASVVAEPDLTALVETWGETMDDVMRSDHPTRIADRILEANGLDPVEQPDLESQVADYITPTFDRLDGDLPAGSNTFARLAIEDHSEGAEYAPAEPEPDMTNGAGAYPDPVNADPYASPADHAPDPTTATAQQPDVSAGPWQNALQPEF